MAGRVALAAAVLAATLAAAGCTTHTHPNGTTLCGTHLDTGAESVGFTPLDANRPAPLPAAPATSRLPAPVPSDVAHPGRVWYVRTSPGCAKGAVVVVQPADGPRLVASVPARDGRPTGIGLAQVTSPVTVAAWVSGRYQGSLVLAPTGSG